MSFPIDRIAFLYTRVSGYLSACLQALKENYRTKILLYRWPESETAPFKKCLTDFIDVHHIRSTESDLEIIENVNKFDPQVIYIAGWTDKGYLKSSKTFRKSGIPVISGMDAQWYGNIRQRLACLAAKWYLHPAVDILWVPGERQRFFAQRLGYSGNRCWSGMYTCDWEKFARVKENVQNGAPPLFLFVGRYVEKKGIDILVRAYAQYRQEVEDPWDLVCAGAGPLKQSLDSESGIKDFGFVQPGDLPNFMSKAAVFILPSRKEAWGVVIHEATAVGLPVICSEACGAGVHLVQDGFNGFIFETENPDHLAEKMFRMHHVTEDERYLMGERSHDLSKQFTPQRWAETLVNGIESWQSLNRKA